jgi:autotransporter-associated beta strand protein
MKSIPGHRLQLLTRARWPLAATGLAVMIFGAVAHTQAADYTLNFTRSPDTYVTTTGRITTTAFTVEAWIRQPQFDAENQIFNQDISGDAGRLFLATINGKTRFQIGSTQIIGNTTLSSNVWYHLAFVRSASGASTNYLNGAVDSIGTLPTAALAAANISIGRLPRLADIGFRGQISDVRVWNFARSRGEIQADMSKRLDNTRSGLIHYWPLNDGSGTLATNLASNARGTISGATWTNSTDFSLITSTGSWGFLAGGNWSATGNWLNAAPAQGSAAAAFFTNNPPAAITVTNDMPSLTLATLTVNGTNGHTFTGNSLSFTINCLLSASIATTNGSHFFELPVQASARSLILSTARPGLLTFSKTISGDGGLSVNPTASGGGTVTLSGTNTYVGSTTVGCGTLSVASLADGGLQSAIGASSSSATNLVIGPGTLRYTGPATSTDRGYTVAPGSTRAAILSTDTDITFAGQIACASGAFLKTGTGTVRYTYPGAQTLAVNEGAIDALLNTGANGDSPTTGFSGFTVSNGKVVMGVPGQTNTINCRITIGHYTTTNANAETAGELEFNAGVLNCNTTVSVGRGNGTTNTAPSGAASRLTVNGGTFNMNLLTLGSQGASLSGFNARPVCDINGGTIAVNTFCNFGETSGSYASLNVRGGVLRVNGQSGNNGISVGIGGTGVLTLSGTGTVDSAYNIALGTASTGSGTVNLDGGTLIALNITKPAGSGQADIRFNGGTFMPRAEGYTLSGLNTATVSTNGARIDTSLASYTVSQNLLTDPGLGGATDGGLIKLGTNTLTFASYGSTYKGATVVSNGTLCIAGMLPSDNALLVVPNAEALIGGSATQTVSAASLTLDAGSKLSFAFALDGSTNDRLNVATSPVIGSGCGISLFQLNTRQPFTKNGTYTILTYSGAAPAANNLSCTNAVYGKTYIFAASSGNLTVTIASDTANASLWNVNASGNWSTAANWTNPPANAAGSHARFDSAISAPVTVTSSGETVGELFFNNTKAYTLGGTGLMIDSDTPPALINVESGAHTISAPLTLNDNTTLNLSASTLLTLGAATGASATLTAQGNGTLACTAAPAVQSLALNVPELSVSNTMTVASPITLQRTVTVRPALSTTTTVSSVISGANGLTKAGSSTLALNAANTYNGITTVSAGTLTASTLANGGSSSSIGASSSSAANWVLGPATFRYTGSATTINRGYTLAAGSSPARAAVLRLDNDLTIGGQCLSTSGAFLKTGPGTLRYTFTGGPQLLAVAEGAIDALLDIGANGDSPTTGFSGYTVSNGKVILGAPGQTNTINVRITVGHYTTTASGAETAGELQIDNGVINCNTTVSIGRGNGTSVTAPGGRTSRLTVNGGLVNMNLVALGYKGIAPTSFNARPSCDINGGLVTIGQAMQIGESPGAVSSLNVRGGTLRISGVNTFSAGLHLGGPQNPSGTGTLTLSGTGLVDVANNIMLGTYTGGTGTVHLAGGALVVSNIVRGVGVGYVRFNGGTFSPRPSSSPTLSGLTAAYVSTNSALVDTSLVTGYTISQNLLTDPGLGGASDGGLVKLGTNTLSVTGTNTFSGLIDVRAGTLAARVSSTNDLLVATNAFFDALSLRATIRNLTGNGTLTNGVIALTGALDAGTNNAPAGARMTLQNLSLVQGSTFVCTWSTNGVGTVTNDFVTVTGALAPEGTGFIDLGRSEANPIPMPFKTTIMSYGTLSNSFAGWKARNTGLTKNVATVITAASNLVSLEVRYGGTLILIK